MHTAPRSILVGVGPNTGSQTLIAATALARREHARLTVLAAVVEPTVLFWASPITLPYDPRAAAAEECESRLRAAIAGIPPDLPVTALLRRQRASRALLAELRTGGHDLVVVGPGRVARALRRRGAPVLVVGGATSPTRALPDIAVAAGA